MGIARDSLRQKKVRGNPGVSGGSLSREKRSEHGQEALPTLTQEETSVENVPAGRKLDGISLKTAKSVKLSWRSVSEGYRNELRTAELVGNYERLLSGLMEVAWEK